MGEGRTTKSSQVKTYYIKLGKDKHVIDVVNIDNVSIEIGESGNVLGCIYFEQ